MTQDDNLIYLVGGDTCTDPDPNPRSKKIWAYDMSSPMEAARPLTHELMHGRCPIVNLLNLVSVKT